MQTISNDDDVDVMMTTIKIIIVMMTTTTMMIVIIMTTNDDNDCCIAFEYLYIAPHSPSEKLFSGTNSKKQTDFKKSQRDGKLEERMILGEADERRFQKEDQ